MKYNFLNMFLEENSLLKQKNSEINEFLVQNNELNIKNLYDFFKSDSRITCISGFLGTGKHEIANYALNFLSTDVITFQYTCFQSTMLDDILLDFFVKFKKLFSSKIVEEPKFKSESFAQKINTYFLKIERPFVIVLNYFGDIQKENLEEITDFLLHLTTFDKVKVIITSNRFPAIFDDKKAECESLKVLALEDKLFEKYLKSEKIKYNNNLLKEFYENTRGYYFYTTLAIKYMKFSNNTLESFFENLRRSFLSFDSFLERYSTEMVPPTSRNLYWLVAMLRHGISRDLLKKTDLYDEDVVNTLIDRQIFSEDGNIIYVREYFKENLDVSVAVNIAQKLHKYIINIYELQLPLKPLERDFTISRQTIRKEIDYHNLFLPKKPKFENKNIGMEYEMYRKGIEDLQNMEKTKDEQEPPKLDKRFLEIKKKKDEENEIKLVKNPSLNLSNIANDGVIYIDSIENSRNISFTDKTAHIQNTKMSAKELLIRAEIAEGQYDYATAIDFCKKALEENIQDKNMKADIYTKIAKCSQKLSNNEIALKNYYLAQDLYTETKNFVRANVIKLNISRLLYETYKFELAKEYALSILKEENNPNSLLIRTYLQLSYIEEGLSNQQEANNYIQKALKISNESTESEILCEIYFKYALSKDDEENFDQAIEYYKKCFETSSNPDTNRFLSSAFSNLAELYFEQGENEKSIQNYQKAYEIDKNRANYEGLYYSCSKLGALLHRKDKEKALSYYKSALEASKNLKDLFYEASATLALGDFYYNIRENELAIEQYLTAKKIAKTNFSTQNQEKIDMRLTDLKVKMGEKSFNDAINKFS